MLTVRPHLSACYRCVLTALPPVGAVPGCAEAGVLGAMAGVIGTLPAVETLKYLLGAGDLLTDRFLIFDALLMSFREVKITQNPSCPVCGEHPTITSFIDYEQKICELKQ